MHTAQCYSSESITYSIITFLVLPSLILTMFRPF
jgi:hypothetical protein